MTDRLMMMEERAAVTGSRMMEEMSGRERQRRMLDEQAGEAAGVV